jgi:hypothetical protein
MQTVFWTVFAGFFTYVLGQLALKLVIEPVQEVKKTIGAVSHALIERANVISNAGVPTKEVMDAASEELRKLASQLRSHLYLVPRYETTARIFGLPLRAEILKASTNLIGLSNSLHAARGKIYEVNASRVESICDSLRIYLPEESRMARDEKQGPAGHA